MIPVLRKLNSHLLVFGTFIAALIGLGGFLMNSQYLPIPPGTCFMFAGGMFFWMNLLVVGDISSLIVELRKN